MLFLASADSIHSLKWVNYMGKSFPVIYWISLKRPRFRSKDLAPNVKLFWCPFVSWCWFLVFFLRKRYQIDLVHVHYLGWNIIPALGQGNCKLVATPWGSDLIFGKENRLKRRVISYFLKLCEALTCDAQHIKRLLLEFGVNGEIIHVINFGVDVTKFAPSLNKTRIYDQKSPIRVIYLRGFEPVYDATTLVHAVAKIKKRSPSLNLKVDLYGDGAELNSVKNSIQEYGLEEVVIVCGRLTYDEVANSLQNYDVFVSTSLSDAGISSSTAEAMACEIPVVVSNTGENNLWIEDGINGLLFEAKNSDELADRLLFLCEDQTKRHIIGRNGRDVIVSRNNYSIEMTKVLELYKALLK